jgi:hypothetical protein
MDRGILQRAPDQPGYVLARSGIGTKLPGTEPATRTRKKDALSSKKAPSSKRAGRPEKPLRVVLTELLAKSRQPLPARELARQAKAHGYRTKSKKFVEVLWVMLGKMDNVENVPGIGYRLKKGKAARN